jgi:hypothetical protein
VIYDGNKYIEHVKHTRCCLSQVEMKDKGMIENERGIWTTGTFDASIFKKKESEQ